VFEHRFLEEISFSDSQEYNHFQAEVKRNNGVFIPILVSLVQGLSA